MSKRSGFAVKITAFIEADPKDAGRMGAVIASIEEVGISLMAIGIHGAKVESRFMLSREVPDAPKPVEAQHLVPSNRLEQAGASTTGGTTELPRMPDIPAAQRRT